MPRMTLEPLTDEQVRKLKPKSRPHDTRDGFAHGLIITVLPSGKKQWTIRYRTQGKQRRLILGDYPTLSLSKARDKAERARIRIRDGHDPAAERTAAKAKRTDTVSALAKDYLAHARRQKKKSIAEDERILDSDVLPAIGDRSVRELTRRDIRDVLDRIVKRDAPIMANRTLAIVRRMLNYGAEQDWLEANPAAHITRPSPERERDRVLTDDEIRATWTLLSHFPTTAEKPAPGRTRKSADRAGAFCPISSSLAAVQKLRLVLGQRGDEIVRMRWADLDLVGGWWTIPGDDTKNGEPHRVPLPALAREIIAAQPRKDGAVYVFTVREGAIPEDRIRKAGAALSRVLGFEFRSHDLRRTAATRMAAAGVPRDHISRVLNHVEGGPRATRTYDRYSYDAEKRRALETWARELTRILEGRDKPENVVQFSA